MNPTSKPSAPAVARAQRGNQRYKIPYELLDNGRSLKEVAIDLDIGAAGNSGLKALPSATQRLGIERFAESHY
jgi:hypothetical protein